MRNKFSAKATALILPLLIALCGCSSPNNLPNTVTGKSEATITTAITPETTSAVTKPTEATDDESVTTPKEVDEEATTTTPSETTAPETTPAATKPTETTPAATKPPQTTPAATKPAETTAPVTAPPETTTEAVTEAPANNQPLKASILNDYTQKWFYNQLNSNQKTAYDRLFSAISQKRSRVSVSDLGMNLNDLIAVAFSYEKDNPNFLDTYWNYSAERLGHDDNAKLQTIILEYDTSADNGTLKTKADQILAEAKKLPNDYERLKYVHDWISEHTVYNNNGKYHIKRADGPILYGEAICSGYSKALMYFAQEMGIPCICIEGRTKEDHLWNMVKLDGSWYHVDMTFDDPTTPSGANALRYDYFLVSDSTIKKDHTITDSITIPSAPNNYK